MTEDIQKFNSQEKPKDERFFMAKAAFRINLGVAEAARELNNVGIKIKKASMAGTLPVNPYKYEAFHMLIGSTLRKNEVIDGFDWEGPTSVVETLEREIRDRGWN